MKSVISKSEAKFLRKITDGRTFLEKAYDLTGYIVISILSALLVGFTVLAAFADKSALQNIQLP